MSTIPKSLRDSLKLELLMIGNANDTSGNGNNGTVSGATLTTDELNRENKAYDFNGSSDFISATNPLANQTDFTINFGFNPDDVTNAGRIINLGDSDADVSHYAFILAGGNLICRIKGATTVHDVTFAVSISTWYNITMTYIQSTKTLEVFKDGISQGTNTASDISNWNTKTLFFGKRGSNDQYYNGKFTKPRFWNQAFTQDQVQQITLKGIGIPI